MTARRLWMIAALVMLAGFAWGCGKDATCPNCRYPAYLPQTSPENVLHNLKESWEFREIDEYAKLLDPDFRFYFQQADIPPGLPRDYWNRDEDSTGTGALFNAATEVTDIRLDLGAFTVEDSVRVDQPDVKRIRLTHAKLEVDHVNGVTLLVLGDIQDMYFRKGNVAAGTDSTKWYLFEWWDQSGGSLKPASGTSTNALGLAGSSPLVEPTTWGKIKSHF